MKKGLLSIGIIALSMIVHAQIIDPVSWSFTAKKIADKTYEVHVSATLLPKWHIYSQNAGDGPVSTELKFTANPLISIIDKVKELGKMEKAFDKNFNSTLKFYSSKVDFVQKIKLKSAVATEIKGSVFYMVCDDNKCLPPKDVPFSIKLGAK